MFIKRLLKSYRGISYYFKLLLCLKSLLLHSAQEFREIRLLEMSFLWESLKDDSDIHRYYNKQCILFHTLNPYFVPYF